MPTRVLIIDPNEAFAMLLKEGLEADSEYRAVDVSSSQSALSALQTDPFDLAILDLGIDDMEPKALLRAIRQLQPELPIMVIPVDGDIVPQELVPFEIKGALTKPFFLPELPARVAEALGRPPPEPVPLPAAALPTGAASRPKPTSPPRALPRLTLPRDDARVGDALRILIETLDAEAALLIVGGALFAHAGPLGRSGAQTLAKRITDSQAATATSGWIAPSHEHIRFGQSISDSGEHLLYSIDVAQAVVLTVAVRPDSALRLVRARARQAADALIALGR